QGSLQTVNEKAANTAVKLGDTLELVLLLDGVAVGFLGGVDQLVGQALSDRLDVTECGLGSHVEGLTTRPRRAESSRGRHDNGVDEHLHGVPLSEELDLGKIALELEGGSNVYGVINLMYCPFVG
ncbi:hypothetical protein PRIPAC_95734, partial [Pristionchus pacificus]|uniref:Uncharacterized protein n=1 Tax=Pristionchus pacificus TaxID=54126 RepID=A0A2A6BDL0_PRIPA